MPLGGDGGEGECDVPDRDRDGHASRACGGDDCDDLNSAIHPGAPEGPWSFQTVDGEGDTGFYPVLALDGAGAPHIVYNDLTRQSVRHATSTAGGWTTEPIATSASWATPLDLALGERPGGGPVLVAWLSGAGIATNATGAWVVSPIVSPQALDGCFIRWISLGVDAAGVAHMAYWDVADCFCNCNGGMGYATNAGGGWTFEPLALGPREPSLALDRTGGVHLAYAPFAGAIEHATRRAGVWTIEEVAPGSADLRYEALDQVVDGSGAVHLAAYVWVSGQASPHILYMNNAKGSWVSENAVASVASADPFGRLSLALDPDGFATIAYVSATGELLLATNASGRWEVEAVVSSRDIVGPASLAVDALGRVHVAYYDWSAGDLRYAVRAGPRDGVDRDCDGSEE